MSPRGRTLPGSSQVIHYVYGPGGMLLAEHDGATGALLREYVWLDDMPLAQVSGTVSTPAFAYIHTGQIGEPLMVTDASQAVLWDVAVDPWGNALLLSTPTTEQDLRYPGQRRQAESGLFQNWMRDYDPTLGRYIESDPIGLAGGSNLFLYANGNPLRYTDPRGECPACVVGGAALLFYYLWNKYWEQDCISETSREVLEWVPVVGDYIGFEDAWNNPSLGNVAGAVVGLVPGVGDWAKKGIKKGGEFYRGARPGKGPDFVPLPRDFRVDPDTGFVRPDRGVSVFDNPQSVADNGFVPYRVDQSSIPDNLQIIQRGENPHHFEIAPKPGTNMTPDQYIEACSGIKCFPEGL